MGIVIKQSIRSSVVAYCGVVIGYVNLLWLFPYFMTTEQVGLIRLIQVSGYLLATFGQMGLSQTAIKFYPQFKEEKSFLNYLRLTGLLGFLLLLLASMIFKTEIISYFSRKSALFVDYFELTLLITALMIQYQVLEAHSRNHLKIVFPCFVKDVQLRLLTSVIVLLYGIGIIRFDWMIYSLLLIFFSMVMSMMIYLRNKGAFHFRFDFSFLKGSQKLARYGFYSLLGAGGTQIVYQIDSVMVSGEKGLASNGIYTIAFFIGVVIEMPKRAILQVISPLISQSFQKNDLTQVKRLYKQASINQFILGGLLLLGIWINLENIYTFIPHGETYKAGMGVVLFIGLGKLSDMLFGPNGEIIVMSRYYRFNVVLISFLAAATILLNTRLISIYGLEGAALASFIAMFSFNLIKWLFVLRRFNMQPFTWKTLVFAAIVAGAARVNQWVPRAENHLADLLLRSVVATVLVLGPAFALKLSPEMNGFITRFFSKKPRN